MPVKPCAVCGEPFENTRHRKHTCGPVCGQEYASNIRLRQSIALAKAKENPPIDLPNIDQWGGAGAMVMAHVYDRTTEY